MINGWIEPFSSVSGGNYKVDLAFVLVWISVFYKWAGVVIGVQFDLTRALRKMANRALLVFPQNWDASGNSPLHGFYFFDASIYWLGGRNGTGRNRDKDRDFK
jgi:hypothetical protein